MADQFPVDVFQTGSGTSTNMNINEVIANRASEIAGEPIHPNDHVNAAQSSNDTFPSAARIAAVMQITLMLLPALQSLQQALVELSERHGDTVKMARTHLMDAVPITFGQEVSGWARSVELGTERLTAVLPRLAELPLGGTAVGTGLNAPEGFGAEVARRLTARTGCTFNEASNHFEAQSSQDAMVEAAAMLKVVALSLHKIAGDLRLLGSGPNGGLGELQLPALQAGSSIMPGKVNPVIPEMVQQVAAQVVGNDATITFAGDPVDVAAQHGDADHGTQPAVVHPPVDERRNVARHPLHPRHRSRRGADAPERRALTRHRHGTRATHRIRRRGPSGVPGPRAGSVAARAHRGSGRRFLATLGRRIAGDDQAFSPKHALNVSFARRRGIRLLVAGRPR